MKMLLTIFLKITHNVAEFLVVLMLLLLARKLVESGVHDTCGGGHDNVHPPLSAGGRGLNLPPNFLKGGLDQISIFRGGLLGKRG